MKHGQEWLEEFYGGLRAFDASSWPMTCSGCGRTYDDNDDYVAKTAGRTDSTGLGTLTLKDGSEQVGLFRHCLCGLELVGRFKDRRDNSTEGRKARKQFDHLLEMLTSEGMPHKLARTELLKLVRGQPNDIVKIL
jgi:hypothetical protein